MRSRSMGDENCDKCCQTQFFFHNSFSIACFFALPPLLLCFNLWVLYILSAPLSYLPSFLYLCVSGFHARLSLSSAVLYSFSGSLSAFSPLPLSLSLFLPLPRFCPPPSALWFALCFSRRLPLSLSRCLAL